MDRTLPTKPVKWGHIPMAGECSADCHAGDPITATRQGTARSSTGPCSGTSDADEHPRRRRDYQPGDVIGHVQHTEGCPNHPSHRAACEGNYPHPEIDYAHG